MEKPTKTFRAGSVQASVFINARTVEGKLVQIPSVSFQKRYQSGDDWKTTSNLGTNDLPRAIVVLQQAYEYLVTATKAQETDEVLESDTTDLP
jgi:hypothetical protein